MNLRESQEPNDSKGRKVKVQWIDTARWKTTIFKGMRIKVSTELHSRNLELLTCNVKQGKGEQPQDALESSKSYHSTKEPQVLSSIHTNDIEARGTYPELLPPCKSINGS